MKLIVSTLIFSGIYTIIRLTLNPPENLISFLIGLLVTSAIFFWHCILLFNVGGKSNKKCETI